MLIRAIFAVPLLLALPAAAQDKPSNVIPSRDVAVTYKMNDAQEMRMSWTGAGQKMRIDMPGGQGAMIVDHSTRKALMVMTAQRMVMEMPFDAAAGSMPKPEDFAQALKGKEGTETIAGYSCTVWRFEQQGQSGTVCLTDDGVPLRTKSGGGQTAVSMVATEVKYGTQDPANFAAPAGYQSMAMPNQGAAPGQPRRP